MWKSFSVELEGMVDDFEFPVPLLFTEEATCEIQNFCTTSENIFTFFRLRLI